MLLAIVTIGFVLVIGLLAMILRQLGDFMAYHRVDRQILRDIQGQVHTRQRKARMNSGVPTEEAQLARMGQMTQGRRVVVGGDEDSELHQALSRQGRIPTRVADDTEETDG